MPSWTIEMFGDHLLAFELNTILETFTRAFMPARQFSLARLLTNLLGHIIRATTTDFMGATYQKLLDFDGTFEASAVVATFFRTRVFTWKKTFTRLITKHITWFF